MNSKLCGQAKPANKILCIGASTYNIGTPKSISQALKDTNFLDDWAVIIAIHLYLKIDKLEPQKELITNHFNDIKHKLVFVDSHSTYSVQKGYLYVLPDSFSFWVSDVEKKVFVRIITDNNAIKIQASNSEDIFTEDFNYIDEQAEPYLPCIDKIMIQLAENNTKVTAGLLLAGCGADGAKGMLAIKNKGGKTGVQNPDECYRQKDRDTTSMPRAAIEEAKNAGVSHEKITLKRSNEIKTLTQWLESIK